MMDDAANALLTALHNGDRSAAVKSLELDINVDDVDSRPLIGDKQTALHLAASQNFTDVVSMLIAKGANINCTTSNNQTPLWIAANAGHIETVRILLNAGANPNLKCKAGYSPLGRTCNSDQEIIGMLESYGDAR